MEISELERREPAWLLVLCGWLFASTTLARVEEGVRSPDPAPEPPPVDLASSPPRELRRLPGVGPSRANAIVRLRRERAGADFELHEVPGIGPRTEERVERWLDRQEAERDP